MDLYALNKDDRDAILELNEALGLDYASNIPTALKTAFTRVYNTEHYEYREQKKQKRKSNGKTSKKSTPTKKASSKKRKST